MRPVPAEFPVSQEFGSDATGGVVPDPHGSEVQQLVAQYGNYQPYGHAGQDIACPIGTPVHAIADGTVLWADWGSNLPGDDSWSSSGYFRRWALYKTFPGIVTVIQHVGWISVYAHLSDAPLNPGDRVTEGQQIALSGNTRSPGVSLGAHLHVEALVDLSYKTGGGLIYGRTDPTPYFGGMAAMGSTITPIPEEWDEMATPQQIQDAFYKELKSPRSQQALKDAFFGELGSVRTVQRLQSAVWTQVGGNRDGKLVSMWRDVVDTNTLVRMALTAIGAVKPAPAVDAQALAKAIAADLTTNQAHQFIVALGQSLPKE